MGCSRRWTDALTLFHVVGMRLTFLCIIATLAQGTYIEDDFFENGDLDVDVTIEAATAWAELVHMGLVALLGLDEEDEEDLDGILEDLETTTTTEAFDDDEPESDEYLFMDEKGELEEETIIGGTLF